MALAGSLFFNVSTDVAWPRLALYLLLTLAPVAIMTPLLGPALDRLGGRRGGLLAAAGAARAALPLCSRRTATPSSSIRSRSRSS